MAPLGIWSSAVVLLSKPKFSMIVAWKEDTAPLGTDDEMHMRLRK